MGKVKASTIHFDEREFGGAIDQPTQTSAGIRRSDGCELIDISGHGLEAPNEELDEDEFGSVPQDKQDMHRMGKEQEMRRVFRQFSLLSFTAVQIAAWEFLILINTQALMCGGRAGLFWSFVWTTFGVVLLTMSLAEMASMAPTAGGQYHWVSEFAPPEYQRFLSYVTGWLASLTWQSGNAAGGFTVANMIQSLIVLRDSDYVTHNWQSTLYLLPILLFSTVVNIRFSNYIPAMQNLVMILHFLAFIAVLVVLWVLGPHVSAHDALLNFEYRGGWPTQGVSLMVGQISAVQAFGSFDAPVHMAEEVRNAGLSVPQAMIWTAIANAIMGIMMTTTYVFSMPSVDDAINDPSRLPLSYVFHQAVPDSGTIFLMVMLMIIVVAGSVSYHASTARQAFAFARDHGLPFSSWLSKINSTLRIPVNAVITSTGFTLLMSLINIGSDTAFNAIVSLSAVAQMATYLISISCVLHRRITSPHLIPKAQWSLGRYGIAVNAVSVAYAGLVFFWTFWPGIRQLDAKDFNWAPVLFVVVLGIALVMYVVQGRKVYSGPVAYLRGRDHEDGLMGHIRVGSRPTS